MSVETALARVAPMWPLHQWIAVNPLWGLIDLPFEQAGREVAGLAGARWTPPRDWLREAMAQGSIDDDALARAATSLGVDLSPRAVREALREADRPPRRWPRLLDAVEGAEGALISALAATCEEVYGAGATWPAADAGGLLARWRVRATADRRLARALGGPALGPALERRPTDARTAVESALDTLALTGDDRTTYATATLFAIHGWASALAHRRWVARQAGADDDALLHLLAAALSTEAALLDACGPALRESWSAHHARWPALRAAQADDHAPLAVAHLAVERAAQAALARRLVEHTAAAPSDPIGTAVFCIDVRSERLRRAVEAEAPVRTVGFAGFFGISLEHRPREGVARPLRPGLLGPSWIAAGASPSGRTAQAQHDLHDLAAHPSAMFSLVEAGGLTWAVNLLRAAWRGQPDTVGHDLPTEVRRPDGGAPSAADKADQVAAIARAASLRVDGPVLAFVGHGASTTNNALAAGLQCGACGGHAGDVNARLLAAWMREPEVRRTLADQHGIELGDVAVVGALHDTTTDTLTWYDLEALTEAQRAAHAALAQALDRAGARVRRERAPTLGISATTDEALLAALRARSTDPSEVRPEWGLAGNHAILFADRARSRGLDLAGRVFLHDYDSDRDPDGVVLEALLTAPMVVAHWINAQYYASVVDPIRFGSGDKVLHDIVGEHLGVVEGSGADLRLGLAWQSVHDGQALRHEPLRLTAVVDAPRAALERVIRAQPVVSQLLGGGWVTLIRLHAAGAERWEGGAWQAVHSVLEND